MLRASGRESEVAQMRDCWAVAAVLCVGLLRVHLVGVVGPTCSAGKLAPFDDSPARRHRATDVRGPRHDNAGAPVGRSADDRCAPSTASLR